MKLETFLLLGGAATAFTMIVAALAALGKVIRFFIDLRDDVREFLLDWRGRPAKDGRPETPGVVHRINTIEQQLKPNGGQSMYDKVTQVRNAVVPSQRQGE